MNIRGRILRRAVERKVQQARLSAPQFVNLKSACFCLTDLCLVNVYIMVTAKIICLLKTKRYGSLETGAYEYQNTSTIQHAHIIVYLITN